MRRLDRMLMQTYAAKRTARSDRLSCRRQGSGCTFGTFRMALKDDETMKRMNLRVQKKQIKRLYLAGQISDEVCAIMLGEIATIERDARRHRA